MTDATKVIGQTVLVDVGIPGSCGYRPAQKGKIIGIIVALDNPIDYAFTREDVPVRHVLVAPTKVGMEACSMGRLTS